MLLDEQDSSDATIEDETEVTISIITPLETTINKDNGYTIHGLMIMLTCEQRCTFIENPLGFGNDP